MESEIDPLIWQTELERVTPHLKVKTSHGGKEWRAHIAQTKKHGAIVESILPDSRKKLAMISDAIKMSLERLQGKERYLNSHFDSMVQEYREVQDRLKSVQERHESAGESVSKYQNNLQGIVERLEEVKSLMDERSGSMTDTKPGRPHQEGAAGSQEGDQGDGAPNGRAEPHTDAREDAPETVPGRLDRG